MVNPQTNTPQDGGDELLTLFDDVNGQSYLYFKKRIGEFLLKREREAERRGAKKLADLLSAGAAQTGSVNIAEGLEVLIGSYPKPQAGDGEGA